MSHLRVQWLVVGGGPCGVVATGLLMDLLGPSSLAWVDSQGFHTCGRLGRYRGVPGNTRVSAILDALCSVRALGVAEAQTHRGSQGSTDCIQGKRALVDCDPTQTCGLSLAVDALNDASMRLRSLSSVHAIESTVQTLDLCTQGSDSGWWTVQLGEGPQGSPQLIQARRVLLVTGRTPSAIPEDVVASTVTVELDDVVALDRLMDRLSATPARLDQTWCVVGNSHSGMLAVMNLVTAGVPPEHIVVMHKSDLRFAEDRPEGWIKFDGTGLKGTVRDWTLNSLPEATRFVLYDPERSWGDQFREHGIDCSVFANGFEQTGIPQITVSGKVLPECVYDPSNGLVLGAAGVAGLGFGFPEQWTDPEGFTEFRVGFNMRYVEHATRVISQIAAGTEFREAEQQQQEEA